MNMFKTALATVLIAGGVIAPAQAAGVATADFKVELEIIDSCTVAATDISFGQVAASGTVNAQGTLTVECSDGLGYDVALSGGGSGDINARQMVSRKGDTIAYQLRMGSQTGLVWGDGTTGDLFIDTGTGFGSGAPFEQPETVYAQATLSGTEPADVYSDLITATVSF